MEVKIRDIGEYTRSEAYPNNKKLEIDEVLGKTIILLGVAERSGVHGTFYVANATVDGEPSTFILRGQVVHDHIKRVIEAESLEADDQGRYDFMAKGFAIQGRIEKQKFKSGNEGYVLVSVPKEA